MERKNRRRRKDTEQAIQSLQAECRIGKARLERVLDRAMKIKKEVEHGQGKNSEDRSK